MYFGEFDKITYGGLEVTNITNRVAFLQSIKDNNFLTFEYQVDDGESPEAIAYNFYGDASLHWVILLLNDIYDPIYGWHLDIKEMVRYLIDKYGDLESAGGGYGGIHHWYYDGIDLDEVKELSSFTIFDGGSSFQVGDKVISTQGALKEVVLEVLTVDGGGSATSLSIVDAGVFTSDSQAQFNLIGGHGVDLVIDGTYSIPSEAVAISNRQYEEAINNEKRNIKILYPENIIQIKQELQYLLK